MTVILVSDVFGLVSARFFFFPQSLIKKDVVCRVHLNVVCYWQADPFKII